MYTTIEKFGGSFYLFIYFKKLILLVCKNALKLIKCTVTVKTFTFFQKICSSNNYFFILYLWLFASKMYKYKKTFFFKVKL